jgi:hypothetical protein
MIGSPELDQKGAPVEPTVTSKRHYYNNNQHAPQEPYKGDFKWQHQQNNNFELWQLVDAHGQNLEHRWLY